jgi:hypothetical protein
MSDNKVQKLYLECILTDQEKAAYSKEMAQTISTKQRSEESLKSFQTQKKAEIAGQDATINLLADKINTGREHRDVECEVFYNWAEFQREFVRKDTGVIAKVEPIPEHEVQDHQQAKLDI